MNLSAWSINRPWVPILLFACFLVAGVFGFLRMDVTRYPDVDIPVVTVTLVNPGVRATAMEEQVAVPMERAFDAIRDVRHIYTTVGQGFVALTAQFSVDTETGDAVDAVKAALAEMKPSLPQTLEEPKIKLADVTGPASLIYTVTSATLTQDQIVTLVEDEIIPALEALPAVSDVERSGGPNHQISVGIDPRKLSESGVAPLDVARKIKEVSEAQGTPRSSEPAAIATTLSDVTLKSPDGPEVPLKSVATVEPVMAPATSFALAGGEQVIAFSVHNKRGVSDVRTADEVAEKLAEISGKHPDVKVSEADSSVPYTLGNYESALHTLYEGALLTIAVVFLFLRSIRATLIAAVALPLSIIPAFWALDVMGFSLNLVSLLGITVVTGILVDDAIVAIENIVRHMHMGKSVRQAAMEGSREISLTIIAISLTIVAVFVPVSFMGGIAGRYFQQFGMTVAITVIVSLLVALSLTPMMSAYFLKSEAKQVEHEGPVLRAYLRLLQWSLGHRFVTVLIGFVVFGISIWSTQLLPSGFLPAEDTSRALMTVELPEASKLEDSQKIAEGVIADLKKRPEVKSVFARGGGQDAAADPRRIDFVINLVPRDQRALSQEQIISSINSELDKRSDFEAWFVNETTGQRDMRLVVRGDDVEKVSAAANAIAEEAKEDVTLLRNIRTTAPPERQDLSITMDDAAAERRGVTTAEVFETIRIAAIGDDSTSIARANGEPPIPVRVHIVAPEGMEGETNRRDVSKLGELWINGSNGRTTRLFQVAEIGVKEGPVTIDRRDGKKVVTIEADLAEGASLGTAVDHLKALPAARNLPAGVEVEEAGDAETMRETFKSFGVAMGLGIAAVLTILVLLFRSILQPITILASLPLSVGGAILALLLFNLPMDMPVIIGFLMLMGIVTKNAIMLVDFAIDARERGMERSEAVIDAGRKRARPIIMTTVAMVAGMVPSALGFGAGGEFRSPMAIAVIGGLIMSTLLSLVFVPALYTVMDSFGSWLKSLFRRTARPLA
ncbi:MAG: efflux RND transporter permease subunit [Parvibaculaceae bacterium]